MQRVKYIGRVYFLWKAKELIYIGSTIRPLEVRLRRHFHTDKADYVTWLYVRGKRNTRWVESYLIARLKPRYNIQAGRIEVLEKDYWNERRIEVLVAL